MQVDLSLQKLNINDRKIIDFSQNEHNETNINLI